MSKKSYFNKFIEDQIKREEVNKRRREELMVENDADLKRNRFRRYTEHITHLIRRKKNNG